MHQVKEKADAIRKALHQIIVGQDEVMDGLLVGLFVAGGHILLEGVPGTAKTMMVKLLAHIVDCDFKRIQFTPDVLPSDLVGTTVYNLQEGTFFQKKGPIFTNFLLADEVNRTPPKTQSALLEAMEEGQVTLDGQTLPLSPPFMVVATENPLEFEGTFPLPEAQLDRFFLKLNVGYPDMEAETMMLQRIQEGGSLHNFVSHQVSKILKGEELKVLQEKVAQVRVQSGIFSYIVEITHATRAHRNLLYGASPRASIALLQAAKAWAAMEGREYVIPDDVKRVSYPVLRHRIVLRPEAQLEGVQADRVIRNILDAVAVPR
ncbi:AAA family ATPase [Candidatus Formimonas warabiya]|uniref:Magnesium chelatase n=1 Tax=Formimonas warabiya TaxID=1761012 RepID=A0A3G1KS82_FORW1|nr:MoxR family ATPase [Candidatus Formimonas warabiya]ATW25373.1 magnesium chelatase [Candidatus Formimonas warabiya]